MQWSMIIISFCDFKVERLMNFTWEFLSQHLNHHVGVVVALPPVPTEQEINENKLILFGIQQPTGRWDGSKNKTRMIKSAQKK